MTVSLLKCRLIACVVLALWVGGAAPDLQAQWWVPQPAVFAQQGHAFWGVLARDPVSGQAQWLPFGIYSNPRSARRATRLLQRNGLSGRVVSGFATHSQLARHAIAAARGRQQLFRGVEPPQAAEVRESFAEVGGFDESRRNTVAHAGFSPQRRATINSAGFDRGRRAQINPQFPATPPATTTPSRGRGNFGTQGPRVNRNRGGFGTQGAPVTRNRGPGFGTQ